MTDHDASTYDASWDLEPDRSLAAYLTEYMDLTRRVQEEYRYVNVSSFPSEIHAAFCWIHDNYECTAVSTDGHRYERTPSMGEIARAAIPAGIAEISRRYKLPAIDKTNLYRAGMFQVLAHGTRYSFSRGGVLLPDTKRWQVPVSASMGARIEDISRALGVTFSTMTTAAMVAAVASDTERVIFGQGCPWSWPERASMALLRWIETVLLHVDYTNRLTGQPPEQQPDV